ncbi:MAG: pseudouridine-5'-phosphate glycosidase [Chloroflexi bacterium]|jgi:pseudouridine-5'-phosphate glycosidase|nr:pseudouridine-5'-phosphate glycosidase [Anaerolineaceae bacterium]NMB89654.1 pseudouridine-5'-phosphate glycosidase [Chloroflexota bacterium]
MNIALETTLITHGLPRPHNVATAFLLEETARQLGCQPRTIAVLDGKVRVGLTHDEILALAEREDVIKAGVRELPLAIAQRKSASTTVSATTRIAAEQGIPVFATGGIGGVHPGPWDVSQDILELSRSPVVVVCAGPKAILDLQATHEMLESFGVTVVGYQTDTAPAFYTRSTHLPVPRVESPEEIAAVYCAGRDLNLPGGVLVYNPIPAEYEIAAGEIQGWRDLAMADLHQAGVSGKAITPFLLDRMAEYSGGRTVTANVQLVKNNVVLGCHIALALRGRL